MSVSSTYIQSYLCWKPEAFVSWIEGYWKTCLLHGKETQHFKPFSFGIFPPPGKGEAQPLQTGNAQAALRVECSAPSLSCCHAAPRTHIRPFALPCASLHRFYDMLSFLLKWPLDVTVSSPTDSRTDPFLCLEIRELGSLRTKKDRASWPAPGQLFEGSLTERTGDAGAPWDKQAPGYSRGDTATLRLLTEPQWALVEIY